MKQFIKSLFLYPFSHEKGLKNVCLCIVNILPYLAQDFSKHLLAFKMNFLTQGKILELIFEDSFV